MNDLECTRQQYYPRVEPRDYQHEALLRMEGKRYFALLMAMRTGKTKTLLDDFGRLELEGEVEDLLVIAPAGVYKTWEEQIKTHVSHDLRSRLMIFTWVSGRNSKTSLDHFLKEMATSQMRRVFLVNVEALSLSTSGARDACKRFASARQCMITIDESTIIKSHKAKRTKFVNDHLSSLGDYRRILSGLPTPRSPLDLWGQFQFLNMSILNQPTYASFQSRYAITQKKLFANARWPTEIVVGYRNTEELAELIEPYSFRVPFRPNIPSTYSVREVTMTPEQHRIYEEMKQMATARLDEEGSFVTATQVITQMLRLHQVLCGHTVDEQGRFHDVPENKTSELLEILDDYSGKAVIWCSYDTDVRKVAAAIWKEYGPGSVARFWGGNINTREEEEKKFKTLPECRFMVATPDAGGRGRTWDVADLSIYFSSRNNLEHRDQSEARVLGTDKKTGADYIDLICKGTVEEKILHAIRSKMDLASVITGDNWHEWVV